MNWDFVFSIFLFVLVCSCYGFTFPKCGWTTRLRMSEDSLRNVPFIIDIKTGKMISGPGEEILVFTNKKRENEFPKTIHQAPNSLEVETLSMEEVTKKWTMYCKNRNIATDTQSYDIRDVVAACMKENVISQIVDDEDSGDHEEVYITDKELQRLHFERTKSNKPMSKEDVMETLLGISDDDDLKFEEDTLQQSDTTSELHCNEVEKSYKLIPFKTFFSGKKHFKSSTSVKVYDEIISANTEEYITMPELMRAWSSRPDSSWGMYLEKGFDMKTALLLLSDKDDEEDMDMVDGAKEFVLAKDIPRINPYLASLVDVKNETWRAFLRDQILELDDSEYVFNYPPISPLAPNVESQFLAVENFMHSKHPLQNRIPANWDDPEKDNWEDSDMYKLASSMTLPGEIETNFNEKIPVWKYLGLDVEEIYPTRGRYLDYVVDQIEDVEQLVLPPVVEWGIKLHGVPSSDGTKRFEDLNQSTLASGMLGGETEKNILEDISNDIKKLARLNATEDEKNRLMTVLNDIMESEASLANLKSDRKSLTELESDITTTPAEDEVLTQLTMLHEDATYFNDLETALVEAEDNLNIDITHPESEWMQYKSRVEKLLDKYENIPDITEDDIVEELSDYDDDDIEINRELERMVNMAPEIGEEIEHTIQSAQKSFKAALGSEEELEESVEQLVQKAFEEMETWKGSEKDHTNFMHPNILKPVLSFSDRLTAFRLKIAKQKIVAEREKIIAEYDEKDPDRPKLPKIPTEADLLGNDDEYMEKMQLLKELVFDPDYEEAVDSIDDQIQLSWGEYWEKEKSRFMEGIKQTLKTGAQEIEGSNLWEDIETRPFGHGSYDSKEDEYEDDEYESDEYVDPEEEVQRELEDLVAKDREHGIHEPTDKYPSRYYPGDLIKSAKESETDKNFLSIDSLYAQYESLKTDMRDVAENLADFQLPYADLESQELAYNFEGRRVPDIELIKTSAMDYNPWMDVYHWGMNTDDWNQGHYDHGAFRTPPAWLLRPEYKDMVGFEVWSKYDRRLFHDWQDDVLDEDVYTAYSVKVLKNITSLYLTDHVQITEDLNRYYGWHRYLGAKLQNSSVTYPVRQAIPSSLTPDIDRGVEYSDEIFELKHGRKLGVKLPPLEKRFENDTFELAEDTVTENMIGTIHSNYYWKPLPNVTHVVEPEKVTLLQPLIDYINHMGKLVSTKDDVIIFDYFGPLRIVQGLQGSMEYMAKQLYPATQKLRLETDRDFDKSRLIEG